MFKRRKAILVRARSPVLAYLQGLALLIVSDTMILDEILRLEGSQLPCFVAAYSVYIPPNFKQHACVSVSQR
jgi:hypothetical protein